MRRRVGVEDCDHRRGCRSPRDRSRHVGMGSCVDGDRAHLHTGVRGVRHRRGPQEGHGGSDRSSRHRIHRVGQHLRRSTIQRCIHEPRTQLRTRRGRMGLHQPLGVLGRPLHRCCPCRAHLRRGLPHPRPRSPPPAHLLRLLNNSLDRSSLLRKKKIGHTSLTSFNYPLLDDPMSTKYAGHCNVRDLHVKRRQPEQGSEVAAAAAAAATSAKLYMFCISKHNSSTFVM